MQDPYAEFGGSVQTDAPPPPPGPSDGQRPVPTVLPVSGRISYDDPSGAGQVILPANANFNTFFKQSASGDQQAPPADPYAEFGGSIAPPVQGAGERFVRGVNAVMGGAEGPSELLDSLKAQGEQIVKNPWMLADPVGAYPMLKGMYDSMQQVGKQADQEWAAGNWDTAHGLMSKLNATIHYVESGVPMIGPIMADMDKHASEGDYAGVLGRLTGLAATLGVEHAPAAIDATGRGIKATGRFIGDAAPYVGTQAARAGAATFNTMKVPAATWFGGEHMGGLGALALGKAAERIPDIPVMEKPVWGGRPAPEPFRVPTPSGEPPPVGEGPPTVGTPSPPTQPEIKYGPTAGKRTIYPSAAGEAEAAPTEAAPTAPTVTDDSIARSVFGLKNAAAAQEKFGADGWQERLSNIRASLEKEAAKPATPTAESPTAETPPVAEAIPPVVYRGTPRDTEFSPSMATSNSGYNSFGRGTYFSEDAGVAKDYAKGSSGTVIPSTLSLKQPFTVDWSTPEGAATTRAAAESAGIKLSGAGTFADPEAATAALKNKGYDGVIVKHEGHPAEFVAFDPASFQAAPEAAPEAPAKTEPPATPAVAIAEKQQAVHDAIDQVIPPDTDINKRVQSQVDFALQKGDLKKAQAALDTARKEINPEEQLHPWERSTPMTPEEAAYWQGVAEKGGARNIKEYWADLEKASRKWEQYDREHPGEDADIQQRIRAEEAHTESGIQLEKERGRFAAEAGEHGTKQMLEQAVKAPEEQWTKMPNWSQRDTNRILNYRSAADQFMKDNEKFISDKRFDIARKRMATVAKAPQVTSPETAVPPEAPTASAAKAAFEQKKAAATPKKMLQESKARFEKVKLDEFLTSDQNPYRDTFAKYQKAAAIANKAGFEDVIPPNVQSPTFKGATEGRYGAESARQGALDTREAWEKRVKAAQQEAETHADDLISRYKDSFGKKAKSNISPEDAFRALSEKRLQFLKSSTAKQLTGKVGAVESEAVSPAKAVKPSNEALDALDAIPAKFTNDRFIGNHRLLHEAFSYQGEPLARASNDRYNMTIIPKPEGGGQAGIEVVEDKTKPGFPVAQGAWMDTWEPHMLKDYGVSKAEYSKLPREQRAQLAAQRQVDHWLTPEKSTFSEHYARTYHSQEWNEWMDANRTKAGAAPYWSKKSINHWTDRFFRISTR